MLSRPSRSEDMRCSILVSFSNVLRLAILSPMQLRCTSATFSLRASNITSCRQEKDAQHGSTYNRWIRWICETFRSVFLPGLLCSVRHGAELSVWACFLSPSLSPFSGLCHLTAMLVALPPFHLKRGIIKNVCKWQNVTAAHDPQHLHLLSGCLHRLSELLHCLLHPRRVLNQGQILLCQLCHQI